MNNLEGLANDSHRNESVEVEVIFDNSNNQFSIESNTVSFLKKASNQSGIERLINHKKVDVDEFKFFLESIGVNSFAFVSNMRVDEIGSMAGTELYKELKGLTGIPIFEEKRIHCEKILDRFCKINS